MLKEAISNLKAFFAKYKKDFIVTYVLLIIIAIVHLICSFTVDAEGTFKIEAGTYRFNDVIVGESVGQFSQNIDFETISFPMNVTPELSDLAYTELGLSVEAGVYYLTLRFHQMDIYMSDNYDIITYAQRDYEVTPFSEEAKVFFETALSTNEVYNSDNGAGWGSQIEDLYQTIIVTNDVYVSDEFGFWFVSNTVRQYDPSELTIQGSYMFKNDLTSYLNSPFRIPFNFTVNSSGNTYQYIAIGSNGSGDMYFETESGNVEVVYDELYGGWPIQEYRSFNLNAPKVLTSEQYSIFKNLVVPLERVTPIRGKWVANDVLSPPSQAGIYGSTIDLKFTAYIQYASANVLCYADQITLFYTDTSVDMFYRVINSIPDLRGYGYQLPYQMQVVDDNSFVSALGGGTKYIDFGEQEQYMPTPFYNWFIVNFSPEPIYDKDQSDNIKDEINSVPKPNVGQMEDVFSPEDYFDENDPTFLANMGMFKDILGNSIMLPIVSLVLIFGVISFVIFGKRG